MYAKAYPKILYELEIQNLLQKINFSIPFDFPLAFHILIHQFPYSSNKIKVLFNELNEINELNELKSALEKSENLLTSNGKILVVSFQSLEDKIVKDYFNHKSGKKRRSSRHYPELENEGPITLKLITKKPLRPIMREVEINPRSRSAKLRVAEKLCI